MEAFFVTQEQKYLDYSQAWSVQNEWKGAKSDNKANWKYSYGESDDYVLFGDWQICFQVYADLYNLEPEDYKISRAREVMEYQMSTPQNDYWWWADGLYMVMRVMTKLYKITGNELYLEKLHEYWQYANSIMYDEEEGLYYRDAKYTFDKHQTSNGKKDFWARGDGWVFAGLAKVLNDVPEDYKYRDAFLERYQTMARAIANAQMPEGYWSRSLLDPDYAPGYETSGTAFFTYGYLWGINNGYLSEKEYGETVEKAWNYLTTIALQPSGKVGYVQPIGENAAQHNVSAETTADFGVGAFLLAASEMSKFAVGEMPKQVVRLYSASLSDGIKLQALFSKVLKPETATDINNYFIDGTSVEGSISFDGERTVTIELSKPLDYGRYTFSAINLSSVDDEDLEDEAAIMILSPVPSYPLNADYTVTAIGYQTGNPPANSIDNNLNTRWSQEGDNQWIKYDLGQEYDVWGVDLAFYAGDQRISFFEIETSTDNKSFEKVLSGQQSSGKTNDMERYKFPVHKARYIRIVCSGNTANKWNSITEARVCLTDEDPFAELSMPSVISSDILMPTGFFWVSSNQVVLSSTGIATLPETDTSVTLTASSGDKTKDYEVLVKARNPEQNNVMIYYEFLPEDLYKNER